MHAVVCVKTCPPLLCTLVQFGDQVPREKHVRSPSVPCFGLNGEPSPSLPEASHCHKKDGLEWHNRVILWYPISPSGWKYSHPGDCSLGALAHALWNIWEPNELILRRNCPKKKMLGGNGKNYRNKGRENHFNFSLNVLHNCSLLVSFSRTWLWDMSQQ